MTAVLASRRFTLEDQLAFARASGDYNPVHIDPAAARRSVAGAPVVHGVHVALWAIDRWAAAGGRPVRRVRASFLRPLSVGEVAHVRVVEEEGAEQLQVVAGGETKAVILLEPGGTTAPWPEAAATTAPAGHPRALVFELAATARGEAPLHAPTAELRDGLPALPSVVPAAAVAGLLAASWVVGMECPGLHSLLAGIDVEVADGAATTLTWQMTRATSPRSPVTIELNGPLRGTVRAFFRPPPVEQASFDEVRATVHAEEFLGQRALVVGGSRGLGEATAKLLAAGGAEVVITYVQGRDDAQRVVDEVVAGGGRCRAVHLDATAPGEAARIGATHLYYFATPRIGASRSFNPTLLATMTAVYVDGFWATCTSALADGGTLRALYPSSVYVADPPADQAAYVVAKAAGEALAAWMDRHVEGVEVVVERFPRLRTDQTATMLGAPAPDATEALLAVLRAMHPTKGTNR